MTSGSSLGDCVASPDLGVKLIELVARNPELAPERFHYYWHTIHGLKATRHVSTQMGGYMNRYVQCHMIEQHVKGLPPFQWDGIVEGWFDSEEAFEQMWSLPGYLEHLRPEEPELIDEQRSTAFLCRGTVLIDRGALSAAGAKLVIAIEPRPELDDDAFGRQMDDHGQRQRSAGYPGVLNYSQALAIREPLNALPDVDAPAAGFWKGLRSWHGRISSHLRECGRASTKRFSRISPGSRISHGARPSSPTSGPCSSHPAAAWSGDRRGQRASPSLGLGAPAEQAPRSGCGSRSLLAGGISDPSSQRYSQSRQPRF